CAMTKVLSTDACQRGVPESMVISRKLRCMHMFKFIGYLSDHFVRPLCMIAIYKKDTIVPRFSGEKFRLSRTWRCAWHPGRGYCNCGYFMVILMYKLIYEVSSFIVGTPHLMRYTSK